MNKEKQIIYTILGIACVGILFYTAMIFPQYYNVFYDKKTLNQITYMDVSLNMYETSYESFLEKLHTIAKCNSKGIDLQSVKIKEIEDGMDNEKLTNIVNKELEVLLDKEVLVKEIAVSEDRLSLREMYTIYTTNGEENINGINYWKIVYDGEDYSVTIVLDAEYYKIYDILIKSNEVIENVEIPEKEKSYRNYDEKNVNEQSVSDKNVSGKSTSVESINVAGVDNVDNVTDYLYKTMKDMIPGSEEYIVWMNGMTRYYGFEENHWYLSDETYYKYPIIPGHNFYGIVEFEDVELNVSQRLAIDEYGYGCWSQGIHLEEMIQF